MSYLLAVGITVGLLAGVLVYISTPLSFMLISYAAFLGWASYFAAGGGKKGLISAFCTNLSGVFWGVATVFLIGLVPAVPPLVFTILFAAIMCWQAKIPALGFIPGTFMGNAAFYAAGGSVGSTALVTGLSLVVGALFGIASDLLAKQISKDN